MRKRFPVQWVSLIVLVALTGQNSPAQQSHQDPAAALYRRAAASTRIEKSPGHAPAKISDVFAEAELRALAKLQREDFSNSDILTSPSAAALDVAGARAATADEQRISSRMFSIYGDKWTNYRGLMLLKDFPTSLKKLQAVSSRLNSCIAAEKSELFQRRADVPILCEHDPVYVPSSKVVMAALERQSETTERAAISSSGHNPSAHRSPNPRNVASETASCQTAIAEDSDDSIVSAVMSEKDGHDTAQGTLRTSPGTFAGRASNCNR